MTAQDDTLRKKLAFRAWHRGTREADLIMGRFADFFLPQADASQLAAFEALLTEQDPDIYDWLTGQKPHPETDFKPLLTDMMTFFEKSAA